MNTQKTEISDSGDIDKWAITEFVKTSEGGGCWMVTDSSKVEEALLESDTNAITLTSSGFTLVMNDGQRRQFAVFGKDPTVSVPDWLTGLVNKVKTQKDAAKVRGDDHLVVPNVHILEKRRVLDYRGSIPVEPLSVAALVISHRTQAIALTPEGFSIKLKSGEVHHFIVRGKTAQVSSGEWLDAISQGQYAQKLVTNLSVITSGPEEDYAFGDDIAATLTSVPEAAEYGTALKWDNSDGQWCEKQSVQQDPHESGSVADHPSAEAVASPEVATPSDQEERNVPNYPVFSKWSEADEDWVPFADETYVYDAIARAEKVVIKDATIAVTVDGVESEFTCTGFMRYNDNTQDTQAAVKGLLMKAMHAEGYWSSEVKVPSDDEGVPMAVFKVNCGTRPSEADANAFHQDRLEEFLTIDNTVKGWLAHGNELLVSTGASPLYVFKFSDMTAKEWLASKGLSEDKPAPESPGTSTPRGMKVEKPG